MEVVMDRVLASQVRLSVLRFFAETVPRLDNAQEWPGGWLLVSDTGDNIIYSESVGITLDRELAMRHEYLSCKRLKLLRVHPSTATSRECYDIMDMLQGITHGGAIRTVDDWVFSFMGLSDVRDEALMFTSVARYDPRLISELDNLTTPEIMAIIHQLKPYFR